MDLFSIIFDERGLTQDILGIPLFFSINSLTSFLIKTRRNYSMSSLGHLASNINGNRHVFVKHGCPQREQSQIYLSTANGA